MKINIKKFSTMIAASCLLGVYITFTYVFFVAYFNPAKAVTIYINRYSEADIEAVILILGYAFGLLATILRRMEK